MEDCKDSKGLGKERFSNASMRLYCLSLRMSCVFYMAVLSSRHCFVCHCGFRGVVRRLGYRTPNTAGCVNGAASYSLVSVSRTEGLE